MRVWDATAMVDRALAHVRSVFADRPRDGGCRAAPAGLRQRCPSEAQPDIISRECQTGTAIDCSTSRVISFDRFRSMLNGMRPA